MWFTYAILTVLFWGSSEAIFKKSSEDKQDNTLKMLLYNGVMLAIFAFFYWLFLFAFQEKQFDFISILKYFPVAMIYNISMWSYYKAMSIMKISIVSPIVNSSCLFTVLLCIFVLNQTITGLQAFAITIIILGIILLSLKKDEDSIDSKKHYKLNIFVIGLLCALGYFALDGIAAFLDDYILDTAFADKEAELLISFSIIYFVIGLISLLIMKIRNKKLTFEIDKYKLAGSVLETLGQYTYIYAYANGNASVASPLIASYSIVTLILSRLWLKEKLKKYQYACIIFILIGIVLLSLE